MKISFLYFLILLLIFFLSIKLFIINKSAPIKIKLVTNILLSLAVLQNIFLIIIALVDKQEIVAYFKVFLYLDFIYVPILLWICTYIYLRNSKINFNISYFILLILFVVYSAFIFMVPEKIKLSNNLGYVLSFHNNIFYIVYALFIIILFNLCYFMFKSKFSNKDGLAIILFFCTVILIEKILFIYDIRIFNYGVISILSSLILANYAFLNFKNK